MRRSIEQDLRDHSPTPELIDDAAKLANAAVELAGLAPTLLAALTSGFAILNEYSSPLWPSNSLCTYICVYCTRYIEDTRWPNTS